MKLSSDAVDIVYSLLIPLEDENSESFLDLDFEIFQDSKQTKSTKSKYYVINSLPISANVMQKCYVNVNCHAKDIKDGIPDRISITAMAKAALALLQKVSTTMYLIDYEGSEMIREKNSGEHYMNLRFSVKLINN